MGLTDIKRYLHTVYGHKRYTVIQMVNESLMTLEFALLGGVFIPYLHHSQAGTVARPPEGRSSLEEARLLLVFDNLAKV